MDPANWTFFLAADASTHLAVTVLDHRICVCMKIVLYNFHIVLFPFLERHIAQNYVKLIKIFLDNMCTSGCDKIILISSNGEKTMTYMHARVVTFFVLVPFFEWHTAQHYVKLIKTLLDSLCTSSRDKIVLMSSHGKNTVSGLHVEVVTLLMLVLVFERHTVQNYVKLIKILLASVCAFWHDKIILISSDGENTISGLHVEVVTLIGNEGFICINASSSSTKFHQ